MKKALPTSAYIASCIIFLANGGAAYMELGSNKTLTLTALSIFTASFLVVGLVLTEKIQEKTGYIVLAISNAIPLTCLLLLADRKDYNPIIGIMLSFCDPECLKSCIPYIVFGVVSTSITLFWGYRYRDKLKRKIF